MLENFRANVLKHLTYLYDENLTDSLNQLWIPISGISSVTVVINIEPSEPMIILAHFCL